MMIDTAKSCFSVDRAAIQPLQKEEEVRGYSRTGPQKSHEGLFSTAHEGHVRSGRDVADALSQEQHFPCCFGGVGGYGKYG